MWCTRLKSMGDAPAPAPDVVQTLVRALTGFVERYPQSFATVPAQVAHAHPAPASPALSMSNRSQSAAAAATADRLTNSLGVDRRGRRRPSYVFGDGPPVGSNKPKKQKLDRKTGENTLAKVIFYGACN